MKNRFRVIYFICSKKLIRLKCYDDERFTRFNSSTFVVWREQLKLISEQVRNFREKNARNSELAETREVFTIPCRQSPSFRQ